MKAVNIIWDVDYEEERASLPTEIEIPKGMEDEDIISDYLSEVTGFCHKGYTLIESEKTFDSMIHSTFEQDLPETTYENMVDGLKLTHDEFFSFVFEEAERQFNECHEDITWSELSDEEKMLICKDQYDHQLNNRDWVKVVTNVDSRLNFASKSSINVNTNVKRWYLDNYPDEPYGEKLNDNVTFNDVLIALNQGTPMLSVLGIHDFVAQRRVFEALAEVMHIPFNKVFAKWAFGRAKPDIAPDDLAGDIFQNKSAAKGYYVLSVEETSDAAFGASVVQFGRPDGVISFAFSGVSEKEALAHPELVLAELVRGQSDSELPLWSGLSKEMVDLITDSYFDMLFVEYENEAWTEEKADKIWAEALNNGLDSVVTAGEDGCFITVYAGAMGSVNWSGHPIYGKPCLEHVLQDKKVSLDMQIQSADARAVTARSTDNFHNKEL